ncbi:hypothetical protein N2152v2_006164 [Parachlorella kessleri]
MSASRRQSAKKLGSSGNGWKDKLRQECFDRLRQERQLLLWAARGDQQTVQGALQQLVSDVTGELGRQEGVHVLPATPPPPSGEAGLTSSSSYATPGSTAGHTAGTPAAGLAPPQDVDYHLTDEEYLELMQALEASLLEDKLLEEAAYLDGLEQAELEQAVDAYLAVQQQQQQQQQAHAGREGGSGAQQPAVLCPICRQAYLVEHQGVILCPRQDLRLDVALERLTLEDLRQRLASALGAHCQRGCLAQPEFGLQQQPGGLPGGPSMLCMACRQCGCFEVVL